MGNAARQIVTRPLDAKSFAPFGEVIQAAGARNFKINNGYCTRYHDLANIETSGTDARPIISIVSGLPYEFPISVPMVERHPFGTQAFMPLTDNPFVVVVCEDEDGTPGEPQAFLAMHNQGVNFRANTWHGILTPIENVSEFLVVDRDGEENNLQEHFFEEPYCVVSGAQ